MSNCRLMLTRIRWFGACLAALLAAGAAGRAQAQPNLVVALGFSDDDCPLGFGDNNSMVEPGERALHPVAVFNAGDETAHNCIVTVSTQQSGLVFTRASTPLAGPVNPGPPSTPGTQAIEYTVDECFPCGIDIVLDIRTDCDEGSWTNPDPTTFPVPANCQICGECAGTCEVANLSALGGLKGAKEGEGARFEWAVDPVAAEYHLNGVTVKANLVPPPAANNPKRPDVGIGTAECETTPPEAFCVDQDAFGVADQVLYYQALSACGPTGADEGPL